MTEAQKLELLDSARELVRSKVNYFKGKVKTFNEKMEALRKLLPELDVARDKVDPGTEEARLIFAKAEIRDKQLSILSELIDSPFFNRVTISSAENSEEQEMFFAKHSAVESNVYSWVSPISTIRFESPGEFTIELPGGNTKSGTLNVKENFSIIRSEITYYTHQSITQPQTVIYQKHISERKQFALPEVVAELEKAQDQIIRTEPKGGFLITGSAGSGKTTLALHRIAYLAFTPQYNDFFQPDKMIAFVTDNSAIKYFSSLLPDLGIEGVKITTYTDWAITLIEGFYRMKFKPLYLEDALVELEALGSREIVDERVVYDELRKIKLEALEVLDLSSMEPQKLFETYEQILRGRLTDIHQKFLDFQWDFKLLDDIDLTILLLPHPRPTKSFRHVVVDEVQNWLPIQLDLIQQIIESSYASVSYIGDIKQKSKAFTIENWNELKGGYPINNTVELHKVYRNTQQILTWLQSRGYSVDPSSTPKTGETVIEKSFSSSQEQQEFISIELGRLSNSNQQIGVIAKYRKSLELFHGNQFTDNIHFLTVEASQGMEFSRVYLLDLQDLETDISYYEQVSYSNAPVYQEVDRQLIYVAATRAEDHLTICKVTSPGN